MLGAETIAAVLLRCYTESDRRVAEHMPQMRLFRKELIMPIHLTTITACDYETIGRRMMTSSLDHVEELLSSKDGSILHAAKYILDPASGERTVKVVYTLQKAAEGVGLELLDIDITLDGGEPVELEFLKKLPQSSEANEYYDVEVVAGGQHLQVETVNRNAVVEEITGTRRTVFCSVFPYQLSVYADMNELNESLGFMKKDQDGKAVSPVLAETFAAPGMGWTKGDEDSSPYSVLVGMVRSIREVSMDVGGERLPFTVAMLDTALGPTPVAMSREVFDLEKLAPGKALIMNAYVKADFAPNL